MKTEHILIIRFSALGDVAMTVPVVYELARQYPELRITVLSQPFARPFFDFMAPRVGFMDADMRKEYVGVVGLNTLYRRLTAKNFTAIADLHDVLRTKWLRTRFNIDQFRVEHINKHRKQRHRLVATKHKVFKQLPTTFENYADVFSRLGYPIELGHFKSIFPNQHGNLRLLPPEIGEKRPFQQWIGIAPYAAHAGKMYPLSLMKKVIDIIIKRHPSCRIFLFGGGAREKKGLDEIAELHEHCLNASAVLSGLEQELILMSNLDVMVSMDSANMHLASLIATPVVSIWGATHPYAGFLGWNQKIEDCVQLPLSCRPCSIYGEKACKRGDYACLNRIKPETVADHVDKVLEREKE
ncbi:MAG: glycosyltransferase family 9 protein [Prevotella sp.]|jgi:ADP-heptose:LPS heptosyltransferase